MNETLDKLLPYEHDLFLALNGSDSVFLDNVMWTITGRFIWIPLIIFLLYTFYRKVPLKEALLMTVFIILIAAACDLVSSSIFKPLFQRYRPTHHPDFRDLVDIVNGYRGGRFGFTSSHAANSFGLATFMSLVMRNRWVTISSVFVWALVNSYSRIYLGVHFIADILAGMLTGVVLAIIIYQLYLLARSKLFGIPYRQAKNTIYTPMHSRYVAMGIVLYIAALIVLSPIASSLPH